MYNTRYMSLNAQLNINANKYSTMETNLLPKN